ncbi:alanine racemase [Alkaliphilus hydrothermalis]|uniref:D-serine deaminase-like pyridoxal phosphate-dependent protein n=1 Tax=Alkaliphilus hydrothermalis TaxID=1482730 RepID=A0ABS2NSX7_9FIRM|nr:D-serine deaminase-like pyridoxal phosphate-dependent protein [Alkaliphilus hydrothermalis]
MKKQELETPCLVVDLDRLEENIKEMAHLAKEHNVELWPMIKTHKSKYIVQQQLNMGAKGILAAKLGEAEKMVEAGVQRVMLAYPIIGEKKLDRLMELTKKAEVYCSVDSLESATILNERALKQHICRKCVIIIDSGLNRLGVTPEGVQGLYESIKAMKGIEIVGVATHGGHVYGATNIEGVKKAAEEEISAIMKSAEILQELGVDCSIMAIGSTPTVKQIEDYKGIKQIRPGNYVFYDAVQVALGAVPVERCALKVLATVISIPEAGRAIIDAGSKILCLDAGAHGNNNIKGYGIVVGYEDILIKGLSEELGKLIYDPEKISLKVGQQVEIIPNHACTVANMVEEIYGLRNNQVETMIEVTARGISQ